jgi:aspartate-semialdehyde dehydrogenase
MSQGYRVAIVGATGAVGQELIKILQERDFPVAELSLLASSRSEGKKLIFAGEQLTVHEATADSFQGVDIALFAGGAVSQVLVPEAVKSGAVAVDNSSSFRLEPDVPLVVPEVNPEDLAGHKGIIANPNCSTIIMVVPLKPLHEAAVVKRVVVSTYQAVSGAGKEAIDELRQETSAVLAGEEVTPAAFPYQIAFNLIPQIDVFQENGYTREEMKMVWETRKILHSPDMRITATTVRVPVFRSHSEALTVETERPLSPAEATRILTGAAGVVVEDQPAAQKYPMPLYTTDQDQVFVGRIRSDISSACGLNLWVAGDQLRKGAATNAVQIAEALINNHWL